MKKKIKELESIRHRLQLEIKQIALGRFLESFNPAVLSERLIE